jgi:hypothetical protein
MKAFPQKYPIDASNPHHWNHNPVDTGMDLRDYFAGQAMQGDISRYENKDNPEYWTVETVAQRSYAMADAMMKARVA